MKVTEEVVKASPGAAAEAFKAASSAAKRAKSSGATPPPADPYAQAAGACAYGGVAPDGRAVYVCGGYPWVADPSTGAWVPYGAAPPPP